MAIIELEFLEITKGLDCAAWWEENDLCLEALSEGHRPSRCAASFSPDDHWLFEFLGDVDTLLYYRNSDYRNLQHKKANDYLEHYVGRRFFDENSWQHQPKRIENLFGCEFSYTEGQTPWLTHVTEDPDIFEQILDRAESMNLDEWAFPDDYLREWEVHEKAGRAIPLLGTGSRGPATIMTSVLSPETFFIWAFERPELISRFSRILSQKIVAFNRILRDFCGQSVSGWWITDDNCALFDPGLYGELCVPVLNELLDAMAPTGQRRYQHSDSDMAHLLDQQRELGVNEVNYGPEIDLALIHEKMPKARIHGHLPPFLLRNGSPDEIRNRILDDFQKVDDPGKLIVTTAGSLAGGTGVGRMRWFMHCVQEMAAP